MEISKEVKPVNPIYEYIKSISDFANSHPVKSHDVDHDDIRGAIKFICKALKDIAEQVDEWVDQTMELSKSILSIHEWEKNNVDRINECNKDIVKLNTNMKKLITQYPTITTMNKSALIMDGENIIDTVELESGRYLMVKSITPIDWNEYAKLKKTFSWEEIEVSDNQYDIEIDLETKEEWETATMTVNVDLLFIKY